MLASELVLSGPEWFPLGGDRGPDPLRLVLGQLADLAADEHALVQIVVRPATAGEQRRLTAAAKRIRAGVPTSRTLRHKVPDGRHVPGTFATTDELLALASVLGEAGRGVIECAPRFDGDGPSEPRARSEIGWMREVSRAKPFEPSAKNGMPAPLMRPIVTPAAPLVTMVPSIGPTMPMSLARMDRTGPTRSGMSE